MKFLWSTYLVILTSSNPETAKKKLDGILESIDLSLNTGRHTQLNQIRDSTSSASGLSGRSQDTREEDNRMVWLSKVTEEHKGKDTQHNG